MTNLLIPTVDESDEKLGSYGAGQARRFFPKLRNLAADTDIVAEVQNEVLPLLDQTRQDRKPLEEEWEAIRRMALLEHDAGQKYKGKSNAYLPVYARSLKTQVSTLSKGLFPSDDYLDVSDRGSGDPLQAKAVKQYLQWEFERVANVRARLKPFLRQFLAYGTSVLKYWYHQETKYEGRSKKNNVLASLSSEAAPVDYEFRGVSMDGLRVSTRNLFYWYMYPVTADSLDDATLVFEDLDVPRQHLEKMARAKVWLNVEEALNMGDNAEHEQSRTALLDDAAGMVAPDPHGARKLGDVFTVTESWTFLKLPKDQYMEGEDPECPLPVRIVSVGNTVLLVSRNPRFTQKHPYLVARANVDPGFFYGSNVGRDSRDTQYLANDFANQTNDCGMYGLNPIVKINPALMARPAGPLSPGAAYYMTDIQQGMAFDRPPIEQIQHGLILMNAIIGMNQDFGGAPPSLQGQGKGAKTATNAQILQRNAQLPLQDTVEDLELDVMIPLMYGAWVLAQQFRSEAVMTRVAGVSLKVSPEDLAIDADMRWMASSQAMNNQQRAQQVISLLQIIPPLVPLLQAVGKQFDPAPLINRLHTDGFGFRGIENVIKPLPQMGMPGMDGQPGMPPQAPPQLQGGAPEQRTPPPQMQQLPTDGGERVRSAVEQGGGEMGEMAPGEGEDFMQVRQEADALAAEEGLV